MAESGIEVTSLDSMFLRTTTVGKYCLPIDAGEKAVFFKIQMKP